MRILVEALRMEPAEQPGWSVRIETPAARSIQRFMPAHIDSDKRWWPMLTADDVSRAQAFIRLTERILAAGGEDADDPATQPVTVADTRGYGRYLLTALFGEGTWRTVNESCGQFKLLELALRFPAEDADLHRHLWEMAHDDGDPGTFLGVDMSRPVAILRQTGNAGGPADPLGPVTDVPRMLFGVGVALNDPEVRAGTEVMGIIRGHERQGSLLDFRVLPEMSLTQLEDEHRRFAPHIVHIVAHGAWRPAPGQNTIALRAESGEAGGETAGHVNGRQLSAALNDPRPPRLVILSACETGKIDLGGDALAAELVDEGVPIVVAMTGSISNVACRIFARAFAEAITNGAALPEATAKARIRTFNDPGQINAATIDWALPAIFVAPHVEEGFRVVDTTRVKLLRTIMFKLGLVLAPVFCARDEFFAILGRLLDPGDELAVLLAESTQQRGYQVGGSRLLRELSAATLRAGHVPCHLGSYPPGVTPRNEAALALEIIGAIARTRASLELDAYFVSDTLAGIEDELGDYPQSNRSKTPTTEIRAIKLRSKVRDFETEWIPEEIANWLRVDLLALAREARAKHPGLFRDDCRPVLLLDDVHLLNDGPRYLNVLLTSEGVRAALNPAENRDKIAVVLFTKDTPELPGGGEPWFAGPQRHLQGAATASVLTFPELARRRNNRIDLLAWRWLLMHPVPEFEDGPQQVLTLKHGCERLFEEKVDEATRDAKTVYSPELLSRLASRSEQLLAVADDELALESWPVGGWAEP
ncbi:CHAT domain-containing protein [Actinoplanes sp. NPDC026623]|uniref:CHAT domain-containing protein n=1 Tax=Actinoplanes sp. NPDC026623 TaxID=3155610 RepID=UPI0033C47C6B